MAKGKKKRSGRLAIAVSRFNEEVTSGLLSGALKELVKNGFDENDVTVVKCPGAFEIPLTAKALCKSGKYCAVICLGAVIKGETAHFEYISYAVTQGIMQLNLEYGIPVTFGVLTSYSDEQALARSADGDGNKGAEAAAAAIEMVGLLKNI